MGVGTSVSFISAKFAFVFLAGCISSPSLLRAQIEDPAQVVLDILSEAHSSDNPLEFDFLKGRSWEMLAYWNPESPATKDELFEAVPDVYRFENGKLKGRVLTDLNSDPIVISGHYSRSGNTLTLFKESGGMAADKWVILYLDEKYLALDMGDLRVFLVPPDNDPF
jgi:hypothetical protein